jgi:hypothetical protein
MARARDTAFLHRIAAPLQPTVAPYYVRHPTHLGELVGWYWQPAGADTPEPLGANVFLAQAMLAHHTSEPTAA